MSISRSPDRDTFQINAYIKRKTESGDIKSPEVQGYIEFVSSWKELKMEREETSEWQTLNLEYDLRTTTWILEKVRTSEIYAQNLYAAMCNNDFQKLEVIPILKEEKWHCSWRHAGGIIADMRQEGDYIDWYCSGYHKQEGYVKESIVTDEIRKDLFALGWVVFNDSFD